MESKILLDDINVIRGSKTTIEFDVVDENDNPVEGVCVVKLNKTTFLKGELENGHFSQLAAFTNHKNDTYDMEVVYGGSGDVEPDRTCVTLYVEKSAEEKFLENSVLVNSVQSASFRLIKWIDINKKLPGKILIEDNEVTIGNTMVMLADTIKAINKTGNDRVALRNIKTPRVSKESLTEDIEIPVADYTKIAEDILRYVKDKKEAPSNIEVNDKKIGFMNLTYTLALIVANSSNTGLITSVNVRPWKKIVA